MSPGHYFLELLVSGRHLSVCESPKKFREMRFFLGDGFRNYFRSTAAVHLQGLRRSCRGAEARRHCLGQETVLIPQLQFMDKVVPVMAQMQIRMALVAAQKSIELPQVQYFQGG